MKVSFVLWFGMCISFGCKTDRIKSISDADRSNVHTLSNQEEAFYDWEITSEKKLTAGLVYKAYSFIHFNQHIHTLELDLTEQRLSLETVIANDICPNPNANGNKNNGKNLRETLSETCNRRRKEGHSIIAGINTGFFDSNDGFPRGICVEDDEPVFVNNPDVRQRLVNHLSGFTLFDDGSISFDKRSFHGQIKMDDETYEFFSINDTIVRLNGKSAYDLNVYTNRYVKNPHEGIVNPIGSKALFIVAKNNEGTLTVNGGYQQAKILDIRDGRNQDIDAPYVSAKDEWVLQITGTMADEMMKKIHIGGNISIKTTIAIGSRTDGIKIHNASMYHYVQAGDYVAPPKEVDALKIYQTTNMGLSADRKKMILFCVDGKTAADRGLDFYEAFRVAKKLGLVDVIRFDGGGSSTMWIYENGTGKIMNRLSDKNGERSCMNYLHIRLNE